MSFNLASITLIGPLLLLIALLGNLLMYFINLHRMRGKVYFFKQKPYWITMLIIFLVIAYFAFITLQPYSDEKFYYSRLVVLILLFTFGLWIALVTLQITACSTEGLFHYGRLIKWSKFESYSWDNQEFYKDPQIIKMMNDPIFLSLTLHSKHIFYPKTFTFTIPFDDRHFIDAILSTKLKVKGQEP